jgi:NAD(P)-dependent dehydrogenase (short-subunit alcohol dehydrogenase family)
VIINVASRAGTIGQPNQAAYGGTKAALASFARSRAADYGPAGIRVNAISPCPVYTNAARVNCSMLRVRRRCWVDGGRATRQPSE